MARSFESLWPVSPLQTGCAICGTRIAPDKRGFVIDHDHETRAIRGILCNPCNCMLGMARDRPEVLKSGAAYLEDPPLKPVTEEDKRAAMLKFERKRERR